MKLLLFSDLHLDASFAWAGQQLAWRKQDALRNALRRVASLAVELDVDALCCGGDLYEQERLRPDTGQFLRKTFAELRPLPVFLAPGNHDWFGPVVVEYSAAGLDLGFWRRHDRHPCASRWPTGYW